MPAIGCGAFILAVIVGLAVKAVWPAAGPAAFWVTFGVILASGVVVAFFKPAEGHKQRQGGQQ